MKNEDILKKAIEKAVKNGWIPNPLKGQYTNNFDGTIKMIGYFHIIYDPDFAKAFWGEEKVCDRCGEDRFKSPSDDEKCAECGWRSWWVFTWQYYLRKMVLEKEPLRYIERFLK